MKKLLSIIIAITILSGVLAGCADLQNRSNYIGSSLAEDLKTENTHIVINDGNDPENSMEGYLNYNILAKKLGEAGISYDISAFKYDEISVKMLAADSDVDIYLVSPTTAFYLKERHLFEPITSDIIAAYTDSCFDYVKDFSYSQSELALMPITLNPIGLIYPQNAGEELALSQEHAVTIDALIETAKDLHHNNDARKVFVKPYNLFIYLYYQYQKIYCDYTNGLAQFNTEVYGSLYSKMLSGWSAIDRTSPEYYSDIATASKPLTNENTAMLIGQMQDAILNCDDAFSKWNVTYLPTVSEGENSCYVSSVFAVINPYSKNKEAAIKALEIIAQNSFELQNEYTEYSMLFSDKSVYPEKYYSASELFNGFYRIAESGFIADRDSPSVVNSVLKYQSGEYTLQEALDAYQREVEIWLNE